MEEDLKLMRRFKNGDEESFEKLVVKYRKNAICFCESFIHDYHIAEDIAQEGFAYIYVYKERYNEKYAFKTYLFTILRNKSIDYIRKNRSIPLEKIPDNISPYETEKVVLQKEERNLIKEKINKLNDDYRTVIYLIDFQDFSYKDAAKIMGKNLIQIKVLIYRARQKLKLLIKEEG
ncbi:RNA polymerase sigma factor [Clostridium sp. MB40-C1]|uniref:RNA polymerase sigma factor n=1 Tax=Clostridium sp. MB40-C1 TaxID=3070996 RepID=UPI0027E11233|nr:RNA polymerase sigma factor [Clostridium sp. MB40-C1]WMJ79359.1 RNA polymerase sigma factor [Clostridium sp. MB40-C1]